MSLYSSGCERVSSCFTFRRMEWTRVEASHVSMSPAPAHDRAATNPVGLALADRQSPALVAARSPLPKKRLVRRLEARSIRRLVGRDETRGSISRATHGRSAALPSRTMVKITVRPIPTARRVAPGPARARASPLPRPLTVSYSALSRRRTKTRRRRMTRRRRRRTGRTRTRRTSARRFTRR